MNSILILLLVAMVGEEPPTAPDAFSCPPSIAVVETIQPLPGWMAAPVTTQRVFERISVYNGTAGGKEYDLAPDDQKKEGGNTVQVWKLAGYRTMKIFLRCRYHDTEVTLSADLPASIESCQQTIRLDTKGKITGKSAMACR
jgi:hypothetical protein